MRYLFACSLALSACAGDPTGVDVVLSPSVISSLDGTTTVSALLHDDVQPIADVSARATIEYVDRNGTPHELDAIDGRSDERGVFAAQFSGLTFDGTGTITVEASGGAIGTATFTVIDRTPPVVEILPPTADLKVGPGLPLEVDVHITDEIGVAEVTFATDALGGRTTVVASGALDTTIRFRTQISANAAPGPNVDLHALAGDLSGNLATADTVTLTVDPTITVATAPDLAAELVVDGSQTQLADPRSIAVSAMDGHLYVADRAGTGLCNPSCIWRIDAATGAIDATPVIVGVAVIEGVAFDATGDNLFYSDRQNRVGRLTWNGTAYANPVICDNVAQQSPSDPIHLVADATLGILVADNNAQELIQLATCATTTVGTEFSVNGNFDSPAGVALGPAGEIYMSDNNDDRVAQVDRATGAVTTLRGGLRGAYGLEWLAGASAYKDSLLVATTDDRTIFSVTATRSTGVVFFRNPPIDLALAGGTLFVVTSPSNGNRGRLYKVTGF